MNLFNRYALALSLAGLLCTVPAARAQEVQVPLDSAGQVRVMDAKLARDLGMFSEYDGFIEARLFQSSENAFALEVLHRPQDDIIRSREIMTREEAEQFRADVSRRIYERRPALEGQDGRTSLIAGTASIALGYHGWAIPVAARMDGGTVAGFYLLAGGAGYLVPLFATQRMSVTDAEASFALYGGTRGIVHGLLLWFLLAGDEQDDAGRGALVAGSLVSIAEEITFFQIADRNRMSLGKARIIGVGGDMGMLLGAGAAELAGWWDRDGGGRGVAALMLSGGIAGMVTGVHMNRAYEYGAGDPSVVRMAAYLGAGVPLAILDLANAEESDPYVIAAMAGLTAGTAVGHRLTRDVNFTRTQGRLITLSTTGGALVGLGIAYLASNENGSEAYTTLGVLGAGTAFTVSYLSFARDARIRPRSSHGVEMELAPAGLMAQDRSGNRRLVPGLSLRIGF